MTGTLPRGEELGSRCVCHAVTVLMHAICLHARLLTVLVVCCMQVSEFVLIVLHLSCDVVILNQCCSGITGEY